MKEIVALNNNESGSSLITEMTSRKLKKTVGLFPFHVLYECADGDKSEFIMAKVKPTSQEVVGALNQLASMCGPELAAEFDKHKYEVGLAGTDRRELAVFRQTDERFTRHTPKLLGIYEDPARESFVLIQEFLSGMELMDSANDVSSWTDGHIRAALEGIAECHAIWMEKDDILKSTDWLGLYPTAERRIQLIRKVMSPRNGYGDWEITQLLARALGLDWNYRHPAEIMDEIAALTPSFAGVSFAKLDALGSIQWPCNDKAPEGTPVMHIDGFVRGKGRFVITEYIPTDERTGPRFPLLLTTGRILSQYNVGAQTRRTDNVLWHEQDLLEIHPFDAENRGLKEADWVRLSSRAGETTLRATITDRVAPGVVYTTFHHPLTQANVVTTDYSDWATNCPEYKVTAVQVSPSNGPTEWQEYYEAQAAASRRIAAEAAE